MDSQDKIFLTDLLYKLMGLYLDVSKMDLITEKQVCGSGISKKFFLKTQLKLIENIALVLTKVKTNCEEQEEQNELEEMFCD